MDWREQFFSSIPTSSNCCPPHLLMKLTQEPGDYHTHVNFIIKVFSAFFWHHGYATFLLKSLNSELQQKRTNW